MKSTGSQTPNSRVIHTAKVVEVLDGHRIRVRIDGLDRRYDDKSLPICYPLLPIFLKINPEVGEVVDIILTDVTQPYEDRRWVGPTISQYTYLEGQPYLPSAIGVGRDGFYKIHEQENPRTRPGAGDLFSNEKNSKEQVWAGRGNSDVMLAPRQVRIRAGKHKQGKFLEKNTINPATLAVHVSETGEKTTIAAVADQFLFIGHNGTPLIPATRLGEITDETIKQMLDGTHPATLTLNLIELLKLMRQVIVGHAHGYDGMVLLKDELVKRLEEFDLSLLASKTMRIN